MNYPLNLSSITEKTENVSRISSFKDQDSIQKILSSDLQHSIKEDEVLSE